MILDITAMRSQAKELLKNLNGGNDIDISIDDYPNENIVELDSILFEKLTMDPELLYNQKVFIDK